MKKKNFFKKINFNKPWNEHDWEAFFRAHDAYRLSLMNVEVRKKPVSRIKLEGADEVQAFEPILREYGLVTTPSVIRQINDQPFKGDKNPEEEYLPLASEDPHFWGEGAPLAGLPIYRDCCRFAIVAAKEMERFLKRQRKESRKTSSEFENLRFHAFWVAINIAEGHQLGYSEDRILGNIAKVKRALRHADQCMSLVNRLSKRTTSLRLRHDLFAFATQLRNALYMWVDELREHLP